MLTSGVGMSHITHNVLVVEVVVAEVLAPGQTVTIKEQVM